MLACCGLMKGILPIGSSSRLRLNQSTHLTVAYSTAASNERHGPRRWITSALYKAVDGLAALACGSAKALWDGRLRFSPSPETVL